MKKHIPNLITLLNLLCGIFAVLAITIYDDIVLATYFVVLGIVFDFFDGLLARLLKVSSPLGLQLDSLADMVTSGVVPGLAMYSMLKNSSLYLISDSNYVSYIPYFGILISLASAYRLAKFNIDTRQTDGFIGLPTPANTLFILSIPLIIVYQPSEIYLSLLQNTWVLLLITFISCYLLNAEIPLFALKFKKFSFSENKFRYLFLIGSAVFLILFRYVAVPLIIGFYILLSVLIYGKTKK